MVACVTGLGFESHAQWVKCKEHFDLLLHTREPMLTVAEPSPRSVSSKSTLLWPQCMPYANMHHLMT